MKKIKWEKVAGLRNKRDALREKGYAQSIKPKKIFRVRHIKSKYGEIWNVYQLKN
jgi:hypothetical protein